MIFKVSIHAPLRGATENRAPRCTQRRLFQSTHPCGVRPLGADVDGMDGLFQSTHPCGVRPAWVMVFPGGGEVSIHALLRGATVLWFSSSTQGGRVSIHAPLRGATAPLDPPSTTARRFNPRTPAGCDDVIVYFEDEYEWFQSTHPCGVRPLTLLPNTARLRRFNPRTPAGCDRWAHRVSSSSFGFNPRTPAGCDTRWISLEVWDEKFQSTHPCGVRR